MTYIQTVSDEDATGYVARVYEAPEAANGGVFETSRAIPLVGTVMRAEEQRYRAVMLAETALTRMEKEAIALVISMQNSCGYCAAHHKAIFCDAGGTVEQADMLEQKSNASDLLKRLSQIISFGLLKHSSEADCVQMHDTGFSDREILEIIIVAGLFHDFDLRVSRLGLEMEDWFTTGLNHDKEN